MGTCRQLRRGAALLEKPERPEPRDLVAGRAHTLHDEPRGCGYVRPCISRQLACFLIVAQRLGKHWQPKSCMSRGCVGCCGAVSCMGRGCVGCCGAVSCMSRGCVCCCGAVQLCMGRGLLWLLWRCIVHEAWAAAYCCCGPMLTAINGQPSYAACTCCIPGRDAKILISWSTLFRFGLQQGTKTHGGTFSFWLFCVDARTAYF